MPVRASGGRLPLPAVRGPIPAVLSDPKRLRTRCGHGYLVSWKHRLRTESEPAAAALVEQLLDDPANVEALRAAIGRAEATMDELAQWLVSGLASGALNLLKTRVTPPILDTPPHTDLFDLLPPEEPKRELESLTFEVVDQSGEGIGVHYLVHAPSGESSGSLPAGERRFEGELEPDADVEVEFSSIVLPLRAEVEPEAPRPVGPDPEPDRPTPTPDSPSPTGTDPSTQAPSPPGPTPQSDTAWFEVRVVDEIGEPIDGVPLAFFCDGSNHPATTDASGTARIDSTPGAGTVTVEDQPGLLERLRPRWEQARDAEWLEDAEHHTYLSPSGTLPVVQLSSGQPHTLVLQPKVLLARIRGMLFDTNRAFLLPAALEHLPRLTALYADHPDSALLLVGHTDTTGEPDFNDPLSLERAESVAAFLRDDAAAWLSWYDASVTVEKRWGAYEDTTMLTTVFERTGEDVQGSPLKHFQGTRGLEPDGDAGPITREALIAEYMALDGTTLPEGVVTVQHGCGEQFPLEPEPDLELEDAEANRRVELFFFDAALGVLPPPPGDTSPAGDTTYPQWRHRASETIDLNAGTHVHAIVLDDPIFGVAAGVTVEATYETGKQQTGETDADGRLRIEPDGGAYVDLRYSWQGRELSRRVFTAVDDVASAPGAWQRLVHLGYTPLPEPEREPPDDEVLEDALLLFQLDYGLEPTATLDDDTVATLLRAHDQDLRPWRDRDWDVPDEPDPDSARPKEEVS